MGETEEESTEDLSTRNLEQVRNILFGDQAKKTSDRMSRIESTLERELRALTSSFSERLRAVEEQSKKQHELLNKMLEESALESATDRQRLRDEISNLGRQTEERLTRLDGTQRAAVDGLRDVLAKEAKMLRDEMGHSQTELSRVVTNELDELRDSKADRETLSELFTEFAARLNGTTNART